MKLKEGHYIAFCWDDESELKTLNIVIGTQGVKYKVIRLDNHAKYIKGGDTLAFHFYDNAERVETISPSFKKATPEGILSETVKNYYVKADNLTLKEGLDALHNGQLFMEVEA